MTDPHRVLTNTAAATGLRTLLSQPNHDSPPLGTRLTGTLTPDTGGATPSVPSRLSATTAPRP